MLALRYIVVIRQKVWPILWATVHVVAGTQKNCGTSRKNLLQVRNFMVGTCHCCRSVSFHRKVYVVFSLTTDHYQIWCTFYNPHSHLMLNGENHNPGVKYGFMSGTLAWLNIIEGMIHSLPPDWQHLVPVQNNGHAC